MAPIGSRVHCLEELNLRLPFWRYYAALRSQPYSVLLDSACDPGKLGRFSFIAADPFLVFRAKRQPGQAPAAGAICEVERRSRDGSPAGVAIDRWTGDPIQELDRLLREHRIGYDEYCSHPVPFLSGAIGYLAYEAGYFIEALPDLGDDDLGLPDIELAFVDAVLAYAHETGKSYLSTVGRGPDANAARIDAWHLRDRWLRRIERFEASPPSEWNGPSIDAAPPSIDIHAHFDDLTYAQAVRTVKSHILAGDAYEVCLTHRMDAPFVDDAWHLYQELRRINPAPFSAFLHLPRAEVVCSSPERFLRLGPDRIAESRPIKGTRPRGDTPDQDERLYRELFTSVKDRAENVMIVDLVRNDFGRVSKFGTVHVPELMTIEQYATVFQLVSTIRGELEPDVDAMQLIKACFPGGSMTGAPKIEAMKIIDRLEPVKRGIYSGSIGYLDFSGPMDLNIVIRTIVVQHPRCYFNVGGAIVADSDPFGEYVETMDKAKALIQAVSAFSRAARCAS